MSTHHDDLAAIELELLAQRPSSIQVAQDLARDALLHSIRTFHLEQRFWRIAETLGTHLNIRAWQAARLIRPVVDETYALIKAELPLSKSYEPQDKPP